MIDLVCDDIKAVGEVGLGRTILKLLILEFFGEEVGQMVLCSDCWKLKEAGLGKIVLRTNPLRENTQAIEAIALFFEKAWDQEIVGFIAVATNDSL